MQCEDDRARITWHSKQKYSDLMARNLAMHTIQLDIPDALAERLAPYSDNLVALLELGLQAWTAYEMQEQLALQEGLLRRLATSGKVAIPQPYTGPAPYLRHTPIPITGKPVSELVIEHRGPR